MIKQIISKHILPSAFPALGKGKDTEGEKQKHPPPQKKK